MSYISQDKLDDAEVIKTIPLPPEETNRHRLIMGSLKEQQDILYNMLARLSEDSYRIRMDEWNLIAQKFGYKNMTDLEADGYQLVIQYARYCVELRTASK